MTRCSTNRCLNNHGFSLMELLMAVAFSVLLITAVFSYFNASNQAYSSGITAQSLQDAANIIINKVSEGENESGTVYRLATAVTYMIPNGTGTYLYACGGAPQTAPCNTANPSGEIYYCQDNPTVAPFCGPLDASARWYYLNNAGNAVYYHHPSGAGTTEEKIYEAPAGSSVKLRFSPATANATLAVEIDVDLSQNLAANITNARLTTTSGDASTYVLLRNHP